MFVLPNCVPAQRVGYHLVISAPFSINMFILYAISILVLGSKLLSQARHNRVVNDIFLL